VVRFADFHGKVVILNFIYTHCPDVCPLHTERIAHIQEMINASPMRAQVQFVTITTDPKQDTQQVLRDYSVAHALDLSNWAFLTTQTDQAEDTTRKIAKAYGLKFTETDHGMQMHGLVTHVIDEDGRLRARFHGLKFEPINLVISTCSTRRSALRRSMRRKGEPWAIWVSCFASDLRVTSASGLKIVLEQPKCHFAEGP
jgi:protein SCO1